MSEIRFLTPKGNKKKALLPCQEGFLMSINALRGLKIFLLEKYDVKYILSSRLNQDCLENLFSRIRSAGGSNPHPTPPEFRFRLRLLILGSKTRAPKNANTEEDQDDINYISADLLRNNPFPKPLSELQINDENLEETQKVSQEY
ncbi:unnamed protein product [Allacma fusca]|uniref:Transposable element P transposase-like RNase H C-terminal domain-containing protein n=1 Tax=Allacma fusca TaxID=39272 RepID=A0A8J2JLY8_9HEXA|nr:unnamed protein product [Allacma fusca]